MYQITLPEEPNVQFTTSPEEEEFTITFRLLKDGITLVTIANSDGNIIVSSKCVNNEWLIPYPYLENGKGNFRFESDTEDYPNYSNFNSTCRLMYYTQYEVDEIRSKEEV